MEQGNVYLRAGAWLSAAALVIGCSSSSTASAGDPSSAARDSGQADLATDAGGGGGDASPPDYQALAKECAPWSGQVRERCCAQNLAEGVQALHLAQQDCVCGPCVSACNYQECTMLQSSVTACQSCIDSTLAGSCASKAAAACAANPACAAYEACLAQ
jgi:hypothetical protein